ncbi:MAG TPA: hybrid sensor histidine kinase/response regulator [Ktedonobacteraceae bacterium]|nr:hybrid sensor histidine kinase/response regulator [Ktedonobacteraceae bacterium]
MDKARILIVDDDSALLQALPQTISLRLPDVEVDTSDSAMSAVELIQVYDYDAIVSDIKMPGMDGLTLLARIQELRPETPTLLITGHGERDLAIQALRGGAYDFIQKPIDRDYVVVALNRAIQTCQMRRQIAEQKKSLEDYVKSLEEMVQARTKELVEANAAKDAFLGIASHELRTPLTTLKGFTQILHRHLEAQGSKDLSYLLNMKQAINRMELLVNDLLNTSLVETHVFVLHRRQVDLVDLCKHLLEEYMAEPDRRLKLEAPDEPIEADIDVERISQVVLNLLSNARKYSSRDTMIVVKLERQDQFCRIAVQDQGSGIPVDQLPYLFERFYQVPGIEVQTGSSTGVGLGLYIAQKIVEQHGGKISATSDVGKGSTFSVTLPLSLPELNTKDQEMTVCKGVAHKPS